MKSFGKIAFYILAGLVSACLGFFLWNFCNGLFAELAGRTDKDPDRMDYDPEFEARYR